MVVSGVFFLGGIIAYLSSQSKPVEPAAQGSPTVTATAPTAAISQGTSGRTPANVVEASIAHDVASAAASASQTAPEALPKARQPGGVTTKKAPREDPDDMGF
jgi:hypothetical protein